MGLTPQELEGYTYAQFELKCKGFLDLRTDEENYFRKLAWIIFGVNVSAKEIKSKNITLDDIWPNVNSIKEAEDRNEESKVKINHILEAFKKQKGL